MNSIELRKTSEGKIEILETRMLELEQWTRACEDETFERLKKIDHTLTNIVIKLLEFMKKLNETYHENKPPESESPKVEK